MFPVLKTTTMPKIAVCENCDFAFLKYYIWFSDDRFRIFTVPLLAPKNTNTLAEVFLDIGSADSDF